MRKQFLAAIMTAHENGRAAQEAILRGRLALWEGQHGRWARAARQFDLAAQIALQHEQISMAAQLRYSQGLALQQIPKPAAAEKTLRHAAELAAQAGQSIGQCRAHQALAEIALAEGDLPSATAATTAALAASEETGQQITLLRGRANLHWLAGHHPEAQADLGRAHSLAQESGDVASQLAIEWEMERVNGEQETQTATGLEAMLARAVQAGQMGLSSDMALEQGMVAYAAGDVTAALSHAHTAQTHALQATDPSRYITYLGAGLLAALAHEKMGHDVAVLDALLTCKNSLQRHLGQPIGQAFNELLDALLPRWGEARFTAALAAYRANK